MAAEREYEATLCGIAGFIDLSGRSDHDRLQTVVGQMASAMAHRGPDDAGVWIDSPRGIALGHRRLAVIDLSDAGHQPMVSACGRYVIVYNGEIYNHRQLRREIEERSDTRVGFFRGHSDTEVALAAFTCWGIRGSLHRFNGMFAFVVWDRERDELTLARDRMGEKPLYYGVLNQTFLFGSELKALRRHPAFVGEIDRDVLTLFLRYGYVPAPYSIYRGIYKLPPACTLTVRLEDIKAGREISPFPADVDESGNHAPTFYWSLRDETGRGAHEPFDGSESKAVAELDALLGDAVQLRMEADVPLGAFLSGGIDSSTVVALMQAQSSRPIRTFTIGFWDPRLNEADHARAVAKHLGTDHNELYLSPEQALDVIPLMPELYDEPFADSSQIPTFLVSRFAREHVTVSLSGDGGDELFCGYDRYLMADLVWNNIRRFPLLFRRLTATAVETMPIRLLNIMFSWVMPLVRRRVNLRGPAGHALRVGAELLRTDSGAALYLSLMSHWRQPSALVRDSTEPSTLFCDRDLLADLPDFVRWMMYVDALSYLPDDILVKVDRASMGVSLEARVPLLDHRVVEFAWRLPSSLKARNGNGKWILRQVLSRYVPDELVSRPKMGFSVPLDQWLRGPLRDWAESLLDETRLRTEGFLDPVLVRKAWSEHLTGTRNWQNALWDVLMFQAWLSHSRNTGL